MPRHVLGHCVGYARKRKEKRIKEKGYYTSRNKEIDAEGRILKKDKLVFLIYIVIHIRNIYKGTICFVGFTGVISFIKCSELKHLL